MFSIKFCRVSFILCFSILITACSDGIGINPVAGRDYYDGRKDGVELTSYEDPPPPTATYTPKPDATWTPTPTPKPVATRTPTRTPRPPSLQPTNTKTPTPQLTPTIPSDKGMIILQGADNHKGLETQVQWVDGNGSWHNVDNWYEQLDNTGRVSWLVWSRDFNSGPFRWVVYNRDGSIKFASQSFYLPSAGQGYLINMN